MQPIQLEFKCLNAHTCAARESLTRQTVQTNPDLVEELVGAKGDRL